MDSLFLTVKRGIMAEKMNEHAEIIKNTVFHTLPYNKWMVNENDPHAEDCGGCIINAEVEKLVAKLDALSPVEDIVAQLEREKEERRLLVLDRLRAFKKAGIAEEGPIEDLVVILVAERDLLRSQLQEIKRDVGNISEKLYKF